MNENTDGVLFLFKAFEHSIQIISREDLKNFLKEIVKEIDEEKHRDSTSVNGNLNKQPEQKNETISDEIKQKTTHQRQNKTMNIKIKMRGPDSEELQKQLQEFMKVADTEQELNKRINELENKYTLKRDFLQTGNRQFYTVLNNYIQGILTKEKALLLLQSYHQQLRDEIIDSAEVGSFIEIDYGDGKGYIPEEFMKIINKVNYYYNITKNNIENADIKQETTTSLNSELPVNESDTAINLPLEEVPPRLETLEMLTKGNSPILRIWTCGKYKCSSLEEFVKAYIKIADNLTPALIRDYLISERTKKPYTDNSIEKALTLHGPGRK